jgi:hypothetical protein
MTSSIANYSCTALTGTNKAGKLKPDSNGYYEILLGAVDVTNSAGEFYTASTEALEVFAPSSTLHRRVTTGQCRSEYGHPKREPGMTDAQFMNRILSIEEMRICAHVSQFELKKDLISNDKGEKLIAIVGKVKPSGPLGATLTESLENTEENVAFSIRSLTSNRFQGGRTVKTLKTVVGWDYVNEPGISIANKYQSPALEDLTSNTDIILPSYLDKLDDEGCGVSHSFESNGIDTTMIRNSLGWQKVQVINPATNNW